MKKQQTFGKYTLHFNPLALHEGRRVIPLSQKQLQTLALIVKGRGQPVARSEFREQIWADAHVDDGNLTQAVFILRKTLGRLADGSDLIETIPGFGYRLAGAALRPNEETGHALRTTAREAPMHSKMGEAEQFRLLVESIDEYAIYMLDCAGRVLTWNAGGERSKGYTRDEVLGQHYSMFFVPEDVTARTPDRELARATRLGKSEGEGWRLRKNGERYWASFTITAIRNRNGKLLGFGKVVRDLTEKKRQEDVRLRMETALRRERDRLEAAAESSMDALYICDALRSDTGAIEDFVFTYLNRNVEKMVSIPREVLLGGRMCELLPVNREEGHFYEYVKVLESGVPYQAEFVVEDPNITSRRVRVRAVPLADGVAISVSDLT